MHTFMRKARIEKGLSQRELGEMIGVAQQHISKVEEGKVIPSVRTAKRIASVIGADWTEFFSHIE